MSKWLVAFDTDKIKQYVFRTSTLKEIRGASALLDRLNRSVMPQIVGGETIYANGGGGLFIVEADAPDAAIQAVEKAYLTATHSGSITGAAVALPDDASQVKHALALLRYKLRAAKSTSIEPEVPVTHPLFRFCDVCGAEYAEFDLDDEQDELDEVEEGENESAPENVRENKQVCRSCAAKRAENRDVGKTIRGWFNNSNSKPEKESLWGQLITELRARGYPLTGHRRPRDFEQLGKTSKPTDYMGLIYADGDGMGRIIESIASTDKMREFSQAVNWSVHDAVADAAAKYLLPDGARAPLPFDVLLLGGDDLVMVTSAHKALEVAAHIVDKFAQLTANRWGKPLTLSASVTLTHTSYPIGPLIQLAESGLKFAKQEAAKRRLAGQTQTEGLINFLVVNSPNHVEFSRYYRETLRAREGADVVLRTMRPYTAAEVQMLLARVRNARRAPRAKLEQLRTAVFKTRRQGTLDAMKATLRTRSKKQRKALFELVGESDTEQLNLPWIRRPDGWTTPILDVVELLDFVEGGPDETSADGEGGDES